MRHAMKMLGLIGVCCASACSSNNPIGSKFVASQAITAAKGGTITVTADQDPNLAGTIIRIPPNALAADTTITVAEGPSIPSRTSARAAPPSPTR
jgi:hypothetical protein